MIKGKLIFAMNQKNKITEIPEGHELAYQLPDGKVLSTDEAISLILEKVMSIDKKL